MNNYKLTKWGAKRLVHYYEDICTSILQDVLYHTMKTGQLIIPEKYPEIKDILSVDMESGLWMDEMNVDYLDNHNCIYSKNIGCSRTTLLKTIDQYQFLTKEFDKDDVHPIQFKKELEKRYE